MVTIRRHVLIWGFAVFGAVGSCLVLIESSRADTLGFSIDSSTHDTPSPATVNVLDESDFSPISDATVTVSDSFAPADRHHHHKLRDGVKVITVAKDGYCTTSVVGAITGKVTVFLKPLVGAKPAIIASGNVGGWDSRPTDALATLLSSPENPNVEDRSSTIQGGLVLKAMTIADLMHFSVQMFFSPIKDTIDVWGKHKIPSNLVLPKQSLFLGAVTLDKTTYRLPMVADHPATLVAFQGEIDQSSAISAIQGGIDIAILNKMTMKKIGIGSSSTPSSDFSQDLTADTALVDKYTITPSQPPFAADVVVASGTDINGDFQELIPTDVKTAASVGDSTPVKTVALKSAESVGASHDVISIAFNNTKGHRLTGVVSLNADAQMTLPEFLDTEDLSDGQPLPASVAVSAPDHGVGVAVFETPSAAPSSSLGADYKAAKKNDPIAFVYVLPSAGTVKVPSPTGRQPIAGYAIRRMEFDPGFAETSIDGKGALSKLQRFTNSHADVNP